MMPSGQPSPLGGAQSVNPSLLRSNSGMIGGQNGASLPSQAAFSSLVSPRTHFNNMNMLGNVANVPSLLNQTFASGVPSSGISVPSANNPLGGIGSGVQSVPLSAVNNGIGFNSPPSFVPSNLANTGCSGQLQGGQQLPTSSGNQVMSDQQQTQQLENQNFQPGQQQMQQLSANNNAQQQSMMQQQLQSISGVGQVKLEPQVSNDLQGQQQFQSLRNLASAKMEPQQIQTMRGLGPVKMEPHHLDQSLLLQQQQQQQQHQLLLSRQPSQATAAQINLMHQQRLLQLQQQNPQQSLLKGLPQQRSPLQQQQLQQQNMQMRSPMKQVYEPGTCARRLTNYMYQQQRRPEDNSIEFWRKFVGEYFAPNAKKKWCVSMYGSGRQTTGVFPQDVWHCEICNRKPGRGFEATVEVLPRLFKIKYESGTLEELLYVDMPREYQNPSGQIVLDYAKAIQESVFEQLRVVREGQLRIVFSPELKICSWEFCARHHEELIPRRLLMPQVTQLGAAAQKYQAATQNASSNPSTPDLQNNCNMFVSSARQLAKALEVPLVNDLGYTKRYVRCLQISEVVNCMKDLIDYSWETETGPMESLAKFPRRANALSGFNGQAQQSEEHLQQQQQRHQLQNQHQQNTRAQHLNNDQNSAMHLAASHGIAGVSSSLNAASTPTDSSNIVERLLHQNSIVSRQQTNMNNVNSPYGGSNMQAPSPGLSNTIPQTQPNPSPFQSPSPSSSNNPPQPSHSGLTAGNQINTTNQSANMPMQQQPVSAEADPSDSQSSVQKIINNMMMSSHLSNTGGLLGAGSLLNDVKNVNGILQSSSNGSLNGSNCLVGNGAVNNNSGLGAAGFGTMGGGLGQSAMVNGIRAAMGNNSGVNGRVGVMPLARDQSLSQQDLSNQFLNGIGASNGFNNLQFDWKPST